MFVIITLYIAVSNGDSVVNIIEYVFLTLQLLYGLTFNYAKKIIKMQSKYSINFVK